MKGSDKFLIAMVGGIVLLVIAALVITLNRPEPTYMPEDTPQGIAHNYLLALEKEEYERAYGYLSPDLENYPSTMNAFTREITDNPWQFRTNTDATLAVGETIIIGDFATATIYENRFRDGDLFDGVFDSGPNSYAFDMDLEMIAGEWKIVDSHYYFASCWNHEDGCE